LNRSDVSNVEMRRSLALSMAHGRWLLAAHARLDPVLADARLDGLLGAHGRLGQLDLLSVFNTGILYRSPPSYQTRSEQGPALNEAELITEWIGAVKAALAPRLGLDGLQHASSRLRAHVPEVFFEVVD